MEKRTKEGMRKKAEYNRKYLKENMKPLVINLNKNADSDILDFLETVDNKSKFMKDLLRKEINKSHKG